MASKEEGRKRRRSRSPDRNSPVLSDDRRKFTKRRESESPERRSSRKDDRERHRNDDKDERQRRHDDDDREDRRYHRDYRRKSATPPYRRRRRTSRHRLSRSRGRSPRRSSAHSRSPSIGRRSLTNRSPPRGRATSAELNDRPRSRASGASVTRRKVQSPERNPPPKSTSSPPRQTSKRSWKFDSPPRDASMDNAHSLAAGFGLIPSAMNLSIGVPNLLTGDTALLASPMGIVAQSLGLTPEQQKGGRELYVGNLPPSFDVNQLIEFLNAALISIKASPWPGNPIVRAWTASDSHFAFAEFRTIEEATVGLQLNGLNCLGYSLRIGRPKTYPTEYAHLLGGLPTVLTETPSSPAAALAAAQAAAVGVTNGSTPSTTTAVIAAQIAASGIGVPKRVEDRPDRLVALDLPCSDIVPEIELKQVLAGFGQLKIFQYFEVPSTKDSSIAGVCIFEYAEVAQQRAMQTAMERRLIGGQKMRMITAEEAITEGRLSEVMEKATEAGRNLREELGGDLMKPQIATRCIMLANLVTKNELKDDKEYFEIVDDVTVECSQFGKVLAVEIPRPVPGAKLREFDESDVGFAFVEFSTIEGAGAARKSLSGRKFGGRTVEAHYFSEVCFKERQFKQPGPNFDPMHSSAKNPELAPKTESESEATTAVEQEPTAENEAAEKDPETDSAIAKSNKENQSSLSPMATTSGL